MGQGSGELASSTRDLNQAVSGVPGHVPGGDSGLVYGLNRTGGRTVKQFARKMAAATAAVAFSGLLGVLAGSVMAPEPAGAQELCPNTGCDVSDAFCLSFPRMRCQTVVGGCWDTQCELPK